MIDRDRNTLYEGDVVEDAAGLLWLVRNDGLNTRDWLPTEKVSEARPGVALKPCPESRKLNYARTKTARETENHEPLSNQEEIYPQT